MAETSTPSAAHALKRPLSSVDAWFFLGASLIVIAAVAGAFLK